MLADFLHSEAVKWFGDRRTEKLFQRSNFERNALIDTKKTYQLGRISGFISVFNRILSKI